VRERVRERGNLRKRERVCACKREGGRERESERKKVHTCVCAGSKARKRESERQRESEQETERVRKHESV